MLRKIIKIDAGKCNGCALCAEACHEGAIGMVDGKAKLLRDDYCDGLGDCLPACPMGAIAFEVREAAAYDEAAVKRSKPIEPQKASCPGIRAQKIIPSAFAGAKTAPLSQLSQWPVQLKLVPVSAPYFNHADVLVAADCAAYACGNFHAQFMRNKVTLIGCPKLDEGDYSQKLTQIIKNNQIHSLTVVRMEVPCCGGLENAVKKAIQASDKRIPLQVVTIAIDGSIIE